MARDNDKLETKQIPEKIKLKKKYTITVANEKGGVGKTTITRFVGYVLAKMGYRVLLEDFDIQGNLTKSMQVTHEKNMGTPYKPKKSLMAATFDGDLKPAIVNIMDNLDLIPVADDWEDFPDYLIEKFGFAPRWYGNHWEVQKKKDFLMKELNDAIIDDYDFIFIDTPPTRSAYVKSATAASDYILLAFQTQSDSLDGVVKFVNKNLVPAIENYHIDTDVIGILPNQMYYEGAIDKTVIKDADELFGSENLFSKIIPAKKRVQNAPRAGIVESGYWDKDLIRNTFYEVTEELIKRIKDGEE